MASEGGASGSASNPPCSDPAWAHCTPVAMNQRKVQCKYCNRVISGGVWRFKQHLAGIQGEVAPCTRVSSEVRIQFAEYMKGKATSKATTIRRRQEIREELSAPSRRSVDEIRLPRGRQTIDLEGFDEG
jgi:BED zinc finger